jgi:hypothetical protein
MKTDDKTLHGRRISRSDAVPASRTLTLKHEWKTAKWKWTGARRLDLKLLIQNQNKLRNSWQHVPINNRAGLISLFTFKVAPSQWRTRPAKKCCRKFLVVGTRIAQSVRLTRSGVPFPVGTRDFPFFFFPKLPGRLSKRPGRQVGRSPTYIKRYNRPWRSRGGVEI